jgi:hypothetical protein
MPQPAALNFVIAFHLHKRVPLGVSMMAKAFPAPGLTLNKQELIGTRNFSRW